jgi:hypothetical protein
MRNAARLGVALAALAALTGCARHSVLQDAYDRIVVGTTTRAQVDALLPAGPVRVGQKETFVSPEADLYLRLAYSTDSPQGVVRQKHLFGYTDRTGWDYRTLTLTRHGLVQPEDPKVYEQALREKQIDPLIDLLAPGAGTLAEVLSQTPLAAPGLGGVVRVRDEARPDEPPPPPGERHLPQVFLYNRSGQMPDFHSSALGFGRWTLLTPRGEIHSAFFVPGQIYRGSHAHDRVFVDDRGFLTFAYRFENYAETVDTLVAVKQVAPGFFEVRYDTTARLVLRPEGLYKQ